MDFPGNFIWKCSDNQAYKQAGNSIVVKCLEKIIKKFKLMKVYKITYLGKDTNNEWKIKYSLRYGNTQDEVLSKLDIDNDDIKQIEFFRI